MPDNSEYFKTHGYMPDGGPIYTETMPGQLIVEPWNAVSSLALVIPAIYWWCRIKHKYKNYKFLTLCIPLLLLGGIGSTLFHAFRTSEYLLLLDALPIQILTLLVSLYLWMQVFRSWFFMGAVLLIFVISKFILDDLLPPHDVINLNYFINGTMIFLPSLLILPKVKQAAIWYFAASLVFFSFSLLFRKLDSDYPPVLSMGTHWLWHIFSAAGAFSLSLFLYLLAEKEALIGHAKQE